MTRTRRPTLVASLAPQRVRHVSAGDDFTLAVTAAGELFVCGNGERGRLGLGSWESKDTFTLVTALAGIRVIIRLCWRVRIAWSSPRRACTRWATAITGSWGTATSAGGRCRRSSSPSRRRSRPSRWTPALCASSSASSSGAGSARGRQGGARGAASRGTAGVRSGGGGGGGRPAISRTRGGRQRSTHGVSWCDAMLITESCRKPCRFASIASNRL